MDQPILQRRNSNAAFSLGVVSIILFIFLIWAVFGLNVPGLFIGIIGLLIGLTSIIGIVYSLKSLDEPIGIRSVFGFIINVIMAILFVITLVGSLLSSN